jgi:sporulation protein YhbH
MSTFKEHKTTADRSATDRSRHKKKIEEAIREGIYNIVSDESIIGQDGKKKIKIPVRGIKEFRFLYGENDKNKKVGSAPGKNVKRGQKIADGKKKQQQGRRAGEDEGQDLYEVEITLEELAHYLFDSLNLPELEKKQLKNIVGEKFKRSGYRKKGIRPRLSKKETLRNKIRRKNKSKRLAHDAESDEQEDRFPFHKDDLKYRHIKLTPKENNNAVIFFMMDTSGSMSKSKKFMARSFFFLLYHFLRYRYTNVELVFISHDIKAREVSEDDFFGKVSSGGTYASSAIDLSLEIISKRYHPQSWNIYSFHCSDGDNWQDDNDKTLDLSRRLKDICQLYCYVEVIPEDEKLAWDNSDMTNLYSVYSSIADSNFKLVKISSPDDIWPSFKRLFGGINV